MFYEIKEDDLKTKKVIYRLIDLSEITEVGDIIHHEKGSYTCEHWYFIAHTKNDKNPWFFNYLNERDAKAVLAELKDALKQAFGLYEKKSEGPSRVTITNVWTDNFRPLEDALQNPGQIDIPEVKLCE